VASNQQPGSLATLGAPKCSLHSIQNQANAK
jgi:hypothetical protein